MNQLTFICPCLFGLESILADEIRRIGGGDVRSENGRVRFSGDESMIAASNILLATAERVLILMGEFKAVTFDQLFEGTKAINWSSVIPKNGAFPVKGYSLNSGLHSVPDCQAIIKKAVADSLSTKYKISWLSETEELYQIQFSIMKDMVTLMIDTSGAGLHKRGYRQNASIAPIKETLAAGIVRLARVRPDSVVYDPFCGSGTFLIESAMKALNIAPGIKRSFSAEKWKALPEEMWKKQREQAFDSILRSAPFVAYGSDIDPSCVELTLDNAKKSGVIARIKAEKRDIEEFDPSTDRGIIFCNPPYGERMLDRNASEAIYRRMGNVFPQKDRFSYYIITSNEQFESFFGRKADKKRKLYNGMIKCDLYMYFK